MGVVAGYALAIALGRVDFSAVSAAGLLAAPRPLAFGLEFHADAILLMAFIYVISAMETIGDISATLAAVDRDATTEELRGGLIADGVVSGVAALFSAFPNTSYSQNVGLVNFTGVVSRHVTAISGVILVVFGLVPVVGAGFATIPAPVIGGGGLIMFSMIFAIVLAVSLGLGLGIELRARRIAEHAGLGAHILRIGTHHGWDERPGIERGVAR